MRLYIRDVLGVESWIRPQVEESALPLLGILRDAGWTEGESAMVEKILSATGLSATAATQAQHLVVFSEGGVERQTSTAGIVWNLGPLSKLMTGPPPEVQSAKREVWNLLKRLKEEVGV